jgi:hypothetical protein
MYLNMRESSKKTVPEVGCAIRAIREATGKRSYDGDGERPGGAQGQARQGPEDPAH